MSNVNAFMPDSTSNNNLLKKLAIRFAIVLGLCLLMVLLMGAKQAHALVPTPDPRPIPDPYYQWFTNCDKLSWNPNKQSPGFWGWVSPVGQPQATSKDVVYGTPSIALTYHYDGEVCLKQNPYTLETRNLINDAGASAVLPDGSPGGTISWSGGAELILPFYSNTPGTYKPSSRDFIYNAPPGGFTKSGIYKIKVSSRSINNFSNGVAKCVGSADGIAGHELTTTTWNYDRPCPYFNTTLDLFVRVSEPEKIQTHAYLVDLANPNTLTHVPGVTLETCGPQGDTTVGNNTQQMDTPSVGFTQFKMKKGMGFCARITSTSLSPGSDKIPGYDGPFLRPWDEHYDTADYANGKYPFCNNGNGFYGPPYTGHCDQNTYEYQVAGEQQPSGGPSPGWRDIGGNVYVYDRLSDIGYDFVYIKQGSTATSLSCDPPAVGSYGVNTPYQFSAIGGNGSYNWSVSPLTGSGMDSGNAQDFNTEFVNETTYTITVVSGSDAAQCTVTITPPSASAAKPYFRVYNGDLSAGSSFMNAGVCPAANPSAGILAFNHGPTGSPPNTNGGAATSLAAFAMNKIYGFTSASQRTTDPQPAKGLSFSNTAGSADYGGDFGFAPCATDYFGSLGTVAAGDKTLLPSGTYAGNTNFSGRKVLYYTSDVTITGDVIYSGTGTWTSIADIPSFWLVVKGNIYITPGVSRLDGVYIAQPTGANDGIIYTCAAAGAPYPDGHAIGANCNTNLTVNGAFIAKTIRLLRTKGDFATATAGELADSNNQAEIFNYRPELFLAPSPFNTSQPYKSFTNLPPVL